MGELDEDGQKSQTSSFKINKHRESLTYDDSANHFFFLLYNGVKVINIPQKLYFAF